MRFQHLLADPALRTVAAIAAHLFVACLLLAAGPATAETIAHYDFTEGDQGWVAAPNGSISDLAFGAPDGMTFTVVGIDPYVHGPLEDYLTSETVRMSFRMRSTGLSGGQVYYGDGFAPERVVNFTIDNDGLWHTYQVNIPPLGPQGQVRIDPGANTGEVAIRWVRTEVPTRVETVGFWDFRDGYQGWSGNHNVANSEITADGWAFDSTGGDPWIDSGVIDVPTTTGLLFTAFMRSEANGSGSIYWGESGFSQERVATIATSADGDWHENSAILPPMVGTQRIRFDPATAPGHVVIQWIRIDTVVTVDPLPFEPPTRPQPGAAEPLTVQSGDLTLTHYGEQWGGFVVEIDGVEMAGGHDDGRMAYFDGDFSTFVDLADALYEAEAGADGIAERLTFLDGNGVVWNASRTFRPGALAGTLEVEVELAADHESGLVHFPWITLLPGLETFGSSKTQGLFAGLEYLADEPSSSQKDITSTDYNRLVPKPHKITFPLMALARNDRYLGLSWDLTDAAAAVHDSPNRVMNSDSHLWGLWFPNVGDARPENNLTALDPTTVPAGTSLTLSARIFGGAGETIVPAVQHYVALRPLMPVREFPGGFEAAADLLAAGWTESNCYDGNGLWAHAYWPGFGYGKAADATAFCDWLSAHVPGTTRSATLDAVVLAGLNKTSNTWYQHQVSHVPWPAAPFVFGKLEQHLNTRAHQSRSIANEFDAQGIRHFVPDPNKPDYGATHWTDHANGFAAQLAEAVLEWAYQSGEQDAIDGALELLDKLTVLYRNTVPRGAQTWEIPLHTPDILASGRLLKCYLIGYEMTGRQDLLDEAIYWAWTGVPLVYLDPWLSDERTDYATIPVLGATAFVGSWFGRPVQWCGLVYRSWLYRLARHDPDGIWQRLADGITVSGLFHTWPYEDGERQGLLPDFVVQPAMDRDGPAINPGTVGADLPVLFDRGRIFDSVSALEPGWFVHAPCAMHLLAETDQGLRVRLDGWPTTRPYHVAIVNMDQQPEQVVAWSATAGHFVPSTSYNAADGRLIVSDLVGPVELIVNLQASVRPGAMGLYE